MNKIGLSRSVFLLGITSALACGCASPMDIFNQDQWRTEEVSEVLPISGLDDSVNRRCLENAALPNAQLVAVIKIRVHRAPHRIALAIPSSVTLREKDKVAVNFDTCQLRMTRPAQPGA